MDNTGWPVNETYKNGNVRQSKVPQKNEQNEERKMGKKMTERKKENC